MKTQEHLNRLRSEIFKARFNEVLFTFLIHFIRGVGILLILDTLVHIDSHFLRILLLFGIVGWSYRDVLTKKKHPIYNNLEEAELIKVFEHKYPQLQGRWIASLQLSHLQSHPAVQRISQESEQIAETIPAEQLVSWGPLLKLRKHSLSWLLALILAVVLISPLQLALLRIFVDTPWPLQNQLDLSQVQQIVPRGESFRLLVKPMSGQETASETLVTIFKDGQEIQSLPMLENMQGELFTLVDGVDQDVHLVFKGGDFESEELLVKAVDRPRIENAQVVGLYPDYIELPDKRFDQDDGGYSYSFVENGTLSIQLNANKILKKATLLTEIGDIEMAIEGQKAIAEVPIKRNGDWIVRLVGEHDFENKDPLHLLVESLADQPPQISYERPKKDLNLSMNAYIEVLGLIEDDYGVARSEIMIDRVNTEQQRSLEVVTMDIADKKNISDKPFKHMIDFAQLQVDPGEVFKLQVQGEDFLGQIGLGRQIAIHIVHPDTLHEEIDDSLKGIKKILEKMVARENKVIELTVGISAVLPEMPVQIMSLALEKQNSLEALSREIFDIMDNINQQVKLNRLERGDVIEMLKDIASGLRRFQDEELKAAVNALMTLREQKSHADQALAAEKTCLKTLQDLLDKMGGAQGYIELIQNVERILQSEKEIRDSTKRIPE